MSGVFNPKNCTVQFVAQIDQITGVTDCSIKDAPEPIHDCNDQGIALPSLRGPVGATGGPTDPDTFFSQITLVDLTYNSITDTLSINFDAFFTDITLVGITYNTITNTLSIDLDVLFSEITLDGLTYNPATNTLSKNNDGSDSSKVTIVLIEDDIDGIDEIDPKVFLETADVELTEEEAGYSVVFQDPTPDDETDYTTNHVSHLDLVAYRRTMVPLKYYKGLSPVNEGTADGNGSGPDTLILDSDSDPSIVSGFYIDDTITTTGGAGSGQSGTIIAYNAGTRKIQIDHNWSVAVDNTTVYEITSTRDMELETTSVDDVANTRKIVRYATKDVFYDDGKPFKVGKYTRSDYPDYDENSPWPPSSVDDPDTFFKKRYRGIAIKVTLEGGTEGYVLVTEMCKELPAPELPEDL